MKIGLVMCGKQKQEQPCAAKDLYISDRFQSHYKWAKQHCDEVYILSAKHGLVSPQQLLEPYDVNLISLSYEQQILWGQMVAAQLMYSGCNKDDVVYCLADETYRTFTKFLSNEVKYNEDCIDL